MRISPRPLSFVALLVGLALAIACAGDASNEPPAVIIATTTEEPTSVTTATEVPPPSTTPAPTAPATQAAVATPVGPPRAGQWIDVDVSNYTVRLMDGTSATQVVAPVGVGVEIDTGIYASTQTGLFYVYSMDASLTYDAPYDTYISHWVGFDPAKANGFHSFLKDAGGNVVDPSTGRVSNGCIRTGAAEAIYAFAEIGMPVYVHF